MWSSERGELTTRSWELKELKQLISKKNINHKMLLCMNCTVFLYDEVEIDHFLVTNVIIMNQSFLTVADPRDPASDRLILSKVCLCNCCCFFFLWVMVVFTCKCKLVRMEQRRFNLFVASHFHIPYNLVLPGALSL